MRGELVSCSDTKSNGLYRTVHRISRASSHLPRPADPCAIVVFGAAGDLTKRLVVPALYNLARNDVLPGNFALIGVDRAAGTTESWRNNLRDMLNGFLGRDAAEFEVDRIDAAA